MGLLRDNIAFLLDKHELTPTSLSKAAGVPQPTIHRILSGESDDPRTSTLRPIAGYFGLTVEQLRSGDLDGSHPPPELPAAPGPEFTAIRRVQFRLSAGVSGFGVDYLNGDAPPVFFRADWMHAKGFRADKLFAVKVSGRSMEPGLYDGDMVVVDTASTTPVDGQVIAANYEGELAIKRLIRDAGQWWLASDNSDKTRYPNKLCDDRVTIIGHVVHKQSDHI